MKNCPAASLTTCPDGQLVIAALMAVTSVPSCRPLGETVVKTVLRTGMPAPDAPPLDIIPGDHATFLAGGRMIAAPRRPLTRFTAPDLLDMSHAASIIAHALFGEGAVDRPARVARAAHDRWERRRHRSDDPRLPLGGTDVTDRHDEVVRRG